jgi:multiple sugar transport system substrate-binding protein
MKISMKKQKYKLLKAGFLTLLVLASCGTSPRTAIRLGYWINNTNERLNNQFIFDAFEQAYPQYRIEPVALVYDSYGEEIPRMKIGKTLPDVIWLREEFIPIFAEQNIILPLDDFLEADNDIDLSRYVNNAIEFSSYQGKIYGLPRDVGAQVMAFNLDIMGDEPLPDLNWTWDDMLALGQKLTVRSDDTITQYGLGWTDWKSLITMNNGRLFSEDGKTSLFNTDEVIEALQFYSDLANVHQIMPDAQASQGLGNPFTGKKAAFSVVGPWDFARLKRGNINYDIRPLPQGFNSQGVGKVRLSGLPLAITAETKNQQAAYDLVKFLAYSDEAQTLQATYSIAMPAITSIAQSEVYSKSEFAPPSMDTYFSTLDNFTFVENHFSGEVQAIYIFNDFLYKIFVDIDQNMVSAESIREEMHQAIQTYLDDVWED